MNKFLLFVVLILALTSTSCQKDAETSKDAGSAEELVVPATFDWGTSRDVNFSVSVTDARFENSIHVISIYAGDPAKGGELLSKGSATLTSAFNTRIYLPNTLEEVFIEKTTPDGSSVTNAVAITSQNVALSMGAVNIDKSMRAVSAVASRVSATVDPAPACPSVSGSRNITRSSSLSSIDGVYAVTGSNLTLAIGWNHKGTLYVCGKNVTLTGGNMNGLNIIVTSGGSLTIETPSSESLSIRNFGQLTLDAETQWRSQIIGSLYNAGTLTADYLTLKSATATNFGTITVTEEMWADASVVFTNEGTITSKGPLTVQNGGHLINHDLLNAESAFFLGGTSSKFDNYGTFKTTGGRITANSGGIIKNSGTYNTGLSTLVFNGTFTNDGTVTLKSFDGQSGTFTNRCKLVVVDEFDLNGTVMSNQSFIDVKGYTTMNSAMSLSPKSFFQTKDLHRSSARVSGPAPGTEWALFRVTGDIKLLVHIEGGTFAGNVLFCANERLSSIPNHFISPAKAGCDIYIPKTGCSDGYGVDPNPPLPDADKDGVIDVKDDYPNDPSKAFKHLQSNYASGGSTVAFEDKWPERADYDLNDIVLNYRYEVATNAANQVVWVKGDYNLLATGGEFAVGSGIQFNIPKSNLVSISGAEVEENQDSIVVILFKNSRQEQSNWNTSAATVAPSKAYSMSFTVKNGPTIDAFGVGNYNPFIWVANTGYGRGYETHLPGRQPTKLVDRALFGTRDDNTTADKPYYSKSGLTWGLEIPVSSFAYPKEEVDITQTYLKFADWARSGGTLSKDWFSNEANGYRNQQNIFSK